MNNKDSFGKKFLAYVKANPIVVMLVIVAIIVGITKDNFFSWKNFGNLMSNTAIRFLIALGVSGCLITKGTDLSAGRQAGLAACLSGILIQRADYASRLTKLPEINMFVVLLIVVAIGACLGLLNGIIITKLKVPPFITTLGTQTIVYGLCLVATDAQPIGGFQKSYIELITGRIGDTNGFHLPYLLFVAALFGAFFWFLYNKMRHGKYMYAIGGNEVAAEVSGVNTTKTLMLIYTTAGIMYATAGASTPPRLSCSSTPPQASCTPLRAGCWPARPAAPPPPWAWAMSSKPSRPVPSAASPRPVVSVPSAAFSSAFSCSSC